MDPKSVGKFIAFAEMTLTSIRTIAVSLHHIREQLEDINKNLEETRQVIEEK